MKLTIQTGETTVSLDLQTDNNHPVKVFTEELQPKTKRRTQKGPRIKAVPPKGGFLRRAVVKALNSKRSVNLAQIHNKVLKTYPKVTLKSVAGVLTYLTRKGEIRRSGFPGKGFGHKTGIKNGYRYTI